MFLTVGWQNSVSRYKVLHHKLSANLLNERFGVSNFFCRLPRSGKILNILCILNMFKYNILNIKNMHFKYVHALIPSLERALDFRLKRFQYPWCCTCWNSASMLLQETNFRLVSCNTMLWAGFRQISDNTNKFITPCIIDVLKRRNQVPFVRTD